MASAFPSLPSFSLKPLLLCMLPSMVCAQWPEWRGPGAQGHSQSKALPTMWSETSSVAWRTALPGRGHSTPVSDGKLLWMTCARETPASEAETKERLKANTGDQPVSVMNRITIHALGVDAETGSLRHDIELLVVDKPQWVHQLNSYASPSPTLSQERLYTSHGSFGAACLDTKTLKILWRNQELSVAHENGPGSTGVLCGDRYVAHFDGSDQQFIAAYDVESGAVAWKTARTGAMDARPQLKKAYGTPLLASLHGVSTLISPAANWVYGYDPKDGRELWKVAYGELGFSMSVRPVADDKRFYLSTSYGKSQVIAFESKAQGAPTVLWRQARNAPKMSSPVLVNDLLFYVDDGGIVSCLDAATGEAHFRERLGGKFSASPLAAAGVIYLASREGVVTVIEASKTFRVLAQNQLDGGIMASPIVVGDSLILRTDKALYRIDSPRR